MADPRAAVTVRQLANANFLEEFNDGPSIRDLLDKAKPIPLPVLKGELPDTPHEISNFGAHLEGLESLSRPSHVPPGVAVVPEPPLAGTGPDTQPVVNVVQFPPRAVGRFYAYRQGVPTFGTGWAIGPSHILTAAHCVYRVGEGWLDKALFIPGDGVGHPPIFRCVEIATPVGWSDGNPQKNPGDFVYDFAVLKTDKPLAPICGTLGWLTPPSGAISTSLGYPAAAPPRLLRSTGRIAPKGAFAQMANDLDAGCSGGPWVAWSGGMPIALGINSFRLGDPMVAYSPPLGEAFLNLVQWVDNN